MAYNIPDKYQDLTPAPQLDKKTLNKMVWLSCFLQASFNYERMQACGWLWGIPVSYTHLDVYKRQPLRKA